MRTPHLTTSLALFLLLVTTAFDCGDRGNEETRPGSSSASATGGASAIAESLQSAGPSGDQPSGELAAPARVEGAPGVATESPQDYSELMVAVDQVWLLVVDPAGRRSGFPAAGAESITEIPGSYVYRDAIDDDESGEPDPAFTITVGSPQPQEGTYRIVLIGGQTAEVTLQVRAYSTDGTRQPRIDLPLELPAAVRAEFDLHFSPAPGSTPRLERATPP